ncbi:MAG TPA: hypothetical protein VGQ83_00320 [Polyangia bacterium]|jgi:hypothetical protein
MLRLGFTLAALAAFGGCGLGFDPQSLVTNPRVLAMVADAPEIPFDGATTVTAVVAHPEQTAGLAFSACPLALGSAAQYACALPEVPLPASGATAAFEAALVAPFLDGLPAAFPLVAPVLKQIVTQRDTCLRAALAGWDACRAGPGADPQACADAGAAATLACLRAGGMDVMLHLVLTLADGTTRDAYKRIRLRDPAPGVTPNRNPGLTGVVLDGRTIADGDTVTAVPGAALALLPVLARDAIERYVDDTGAAATEELFISWFATAGDFEYIRSLPSVPDDRLTLPAALQGPITVWVIAHDNRYGASVLSFQITTAADAGTP